MINRVRPVLAISWIVLTVGGCCHRGGICVPRTSHVGCPVSSAELVEALPGGVFFTKLELDYQPVRRKTVNPENNQATQKRVIQRTLRLVIAGPNHIQSDQAVDEYIQALRVCEFLSQVAEEIQITSRQESELNERTVILYEIECPFIEQ